MLWGISLTTAILSPTPGTPPLLDLLPFPMTRPPLPVRTVTTIGNLDANLDVGESITCSASYAVTQADIDAGNVVNIASATANSITSNQDTVTVNAVLTPALTLDKTSTAPSFSAVGDIIDYSYLVTNTGNTTLAGPVTVADDKTTVTCPDLNTIGNLDANLDVDESITCSASYAVTQADIDAGNVVNIASATANSITSKQDTVTVNAVQTSALTLDKTSTAPSFSAVGNIIDYSYLVTNTGNTTLAGPVTVSDDKTTVTCPDVTTIGNLDANLDVGESITCSASYAVIQADIDAGNVVNIASATANSITSNQDTVTVNAVQTSALTLDNTSTAPSFSAVGNIIDYSYLVTNTGNTTLAGPVTVSDDKTTVTCPDVTTIGNLDANLDVGESITCSASYAVIQADIDAGNVVNIASATADGTTSNQDTVTVNAVQTSALTLDKTSTTPGFSACGRYH